MKKKNKEDYVILQERLQKLESDYSSAKEKLKMYALDGDLSENADWVILENKVNDLQIKISLLKAQMREINIKNDEVITYRSLENGEEKTIRLTNWEADLDQGKISRISPLGMALADKKVGEITEVKINQKKYKIQILAIK